MNLFLNLQFAFMNEYIIFNKWIAIHLEFFFPPPIEEEYNKGPCPRTDRDAVVGVYIE